MSNKFVGHGPYHYAKGGEVEAPKKHVKAELAFMKDKGAPSSMISAEKKEHGLPFGGKGKAPPFGSKPKPFAGGGGIDDETRARAMAWVDKRRAQQDAEGAGDESAAEPTYTPPAERPAKRAAPAAKPAAKASSRADSDYSNEGRSGPKMRQTGMGLMPPIEPARPGPAKPGFTAADVDAGRTRVLGNDDIIKAVKARNRNEDYGNEDRPRRTRQTGMGPMAYAKGGSIDGCATKGKTRGKVV